jgi:hypothetical protein
MNRIPNFRPHGHTARLIRNNEPEQEDDTQAMKALLNLSCTVQRLSASDQEMVMDRMVRRLFTTRTRSLNSLA